MSIIQQFLLLFVSAHVQRHVFLLGFGAALEPSVRARERHELPPRNRVALLPSREVSRLNQRGSGTESLRMSTLYIKLVVAGMVFLLSCSQVNHVVVDDRLTISLGLENQVMLYNPNLLTTYFFVLP